MLGAFARLRPQQIVTAAFGRALYQLDVVIQDRETGAAPTFRDRRRRADLYTKWPSHITAVAKR